MHLNAEYPGFDHLVLHDFVGSDERPLPAVMSGLTASSLRPRVVRSTPAVANLVWSR